MVAKLFWGLQSAGADTEIAGVPEIPTCFGGSQVGPDITREARRIRRSRKVRSYVRGQSWAPPSICCLRQLLQLASWMGQT